MFGIKNTDFKNVSLVFIIQVMLWTGVFIGNILLNSLLIKQLGIEFAPISYIILAVMSIFCYGLYEHINRIYDVNTTLFLCNFTSALALFLSRIFMNSTELVHDKFSFNIVLTYTTLLFVYSFSTTIIISYSLTFIGNVFRPLKLKKLSSLFSLTPMVSGILSSLLATTTIEWFGIFELFVIWGFTFLISSGIQYFFYVKTSIKSILSPINKSSEAQPKSPSILSNLMKINKNYLAVYLIFITFYSGLMLQINNYELAYIANIEFQNVDDIAIFFSNIQILINILIILFYLYFKEKLLNYYGLFFNLTTLPVICLIGFLASLMYPDIWIITVFRICVAVTLNNAFQPALQYAYGIIEPKNRPTVITLSEVALKIAGAFAAVFLILIPNINIINLISIIFSVIFVYLLYVGHKKYLTSIKKNFSNKSLISNTLEYLEDGHDNELNELMCNLLLSKSDALEDDMAFEKIKIIQTLERLGNPAMIRPLFLVLDDPADDIRLASIKALNHLFKNVRENPFVYHYFCEKMKEIFLSDPDDNIRALALQFIHEHTKKKEFIDFFLNILTGGSTQNRLTVLQTLNKMTMEFGDLIQIQFLNDPEPKIRGQVAANLWKYPLYRKSAEQIINELVSSTNNRCVEAGLSALILLENRGEFYNQIQQCLDSPFIDIQILASLLCASIASGNKKWEYVNLTSHLLINTDHILDYQWKVFTENLVNLKDDDLIDSFLNIFVKKYNVSPAEFKGLRYLAEFMLPKPDTHINI